MTMLSGAALESPSDEFCEIVDGDANNMALSYRSMNFVNVELES